MSYKLTPQCDRYKIADGSLAHLFWVCPLLNGFWSSICDWFSKVYSKDIPLDPKLTLLGCSEVFLDCTLEEQQTLMLGMVVVKKIILLDWKTSLPPCFKKWLHEMISVIHLEFILWIQIKPQICENMGSISELYQNELARLGKVSHSNVIWLQLFFFFF